MPGLPLLLQLPQPPLLPPPQPQLPSYGFCCPAAASCAAATPAATVTVSAATPATALTGAAVVAAATFVASTALLAQLVAWCCCSHGCCCCRCRWCLLAFTGCPYSSGITPDSLTQPYSALQLLLLLLPQVVPPGFHLVPLPFKDDIRQPESDPALVSRVTAAGGRSGPPRANREQVQPYCPHHHHQQQQQA
jgi:hypothetical protein